MDFGELLKEGPRHRARIRTGGRTGRRPRQSMSTTAWFAGERRGGACWKEARREHDGETHQAGTSWGKGEGGKGREKNWEIDMFGDLCRHLKGHPLGGRGRKPRSPCQRDCHSLLILLTGEGREERAPTCCLSIPLRKKEEGRGIFLLETSHIHGGKGESPIYALLR